MADFNGDASDSGTSPAATPGFKRKSSELGGPEKRAKRSRYISIACNECKRRKIKCNGQTPCQRCGNLGLECVYAPNCCNAFKDTDEFKTMNAAIQALQSQVDGLYSSMNALKGQMEIPGGSGMGLNGSPYDQYQPGVAMGGGMAATAGYTASARPPQPKHPRFRGSTSALFNLGVAKNSLQHMGITGEDGEEGFMTHDQTPAGSPPPPLIQPDLPDPVALHADKDAIWSVNKEEASRLLDLWVDGVGTMYPIVDIDRLGRHANLLFTFMEAARRSRLMEAGLPGADAIHDEQTNLLKLVLAVALTLEASGPQELGIKLWNCVKAPIEAISFSSPDVKGLQLLILAAMYHFHCGDESMAWRLTGNAARMAMELGLHRGATYGTIFTNESERHAALVTFWTIYVLDRRWSFGTGMPFALQEADIDSLVQKPDPTSTPYLVSMIAYSQLGSKVWARVANADSNRAPLTSEEMDYLDYQVMQWHRALPESLSYVSAETPLHESRLSRTDQRLRTNMYCRMNQMRILIYRPVMLTATSIQENAREAQTGVDVAKDTIRVIKQFDEVTDLYRTQQVMFNYFLVQALAMLFLAVAHAPAQFSQQCRDEFFMALDLVRGMTAQSYVSKRLWKTIRGLKAIAPKLGLQVQARMVDSVDRHSSAAVAMVGLAGNPIDEMALYGNGIGAHLSPNRMANDLTSLYEAAGDISALVNSGFGDAAAAPNGDAMAAGYFGQQDELSRVLKDWF